MLLSDVTRSVLLLPVAEPVLGNINRILPRQRRERGLFREARLRHSNRGPRRERDSFRAGEALEEADKWQSLGERSNLERGRFSLDTRWRFSIL